MCYISEIYGTSRIWRPIDGPVLPQCDFDVIRDVFVIFDLEYNQILIDRPDGQEIPIEQIRGVQAGSKLLVKRNSDISVGADIRLADIIDNDLGPRLMLHLVIQLHHQWLVRLIETFVLTGHDLIGHLPCERLLQLGNVIPEFDFSQNEWCCRLRCRYGCGI